MEAETHKIKNKISIKQMTSLATFPSISFISKTKHLPSNHFLSVSLKNQCHLLTFLNIRTVQMIIYPKLQTSLLVLIVLNGKCLTCYFLFMWESLPRPQNPFFNVTIRIIFSQLETGKKTGRNLVGLEKERKSVKLSMTTFA